MNTRRRGSMRAAGMVVVAILAILVGILIVWKMKDEKPGPGVSAVPLNAPGTRPAVAGIKDNIKKPAGAAGAAGVGGVDRDLEIQVVDSVSKQPIAGAELSINMDRMGNRKDRTEAQGRGWVMLPAEDPKYLSIGVKKEGYVSRQMQWRGEAIPATLEVALERATSIGGIIKDEEGYLIAGAKVNVMFPGDSSKGQRSIYNSEGPFISDAEGKWRCDAAPSDLANLLMRVEHTKYISDESYGATPRPADAELRAMTAVSVLKRGLAVEGVVLDEAGKPIVGASVTQGADRFGSNVPKMKTDEEGKFTFPNARPGQLILTVMAKNHAPDAKTVTVSKNMPPVEFRLGKGSVIRGKIVDKSGNPVAGASVVADGWRGNRSLNWSTKTKGDGTFVWNEAPADEVLLDIYKQGYQSSRRITASASEKEWSITLLPPQRMSGTVVDAETGKPIDSFRVIPGIGWDNNPQVHWDANMESKSARDGKYEMEFTEPYPQRLIKIEAAGYLPAISPVYKPEQTENVFDAKLSKGTPVVGTIVRNDGTPAAEVDVALAAGGSAMSLQNGKLDNRSFGNATAILRTGADGKFEFPPQVEKFMIVAAGEDGYALVKQDEFKASPQIKLVQWGKVSGSLKMGSKVGANEPITLSFNSAYEQNGPRFYAQYNTRTDKDGKFSFERAMSGEGWVSRQIMINRGRVSMGNNTHSERFDLKPGGSVNVQLGGKGRPIIGKIAMPKEGADAGWNLQGGLNSKQAEPKRPADYEKWTAAKQQEWMNEYYKSDEYKELSKKTRYYTLIPEADGTFRVEDVVPGSYHVYASANEQTSQFQEQVALAQSEVTIAEIPGGQSDEPVDMGTLQLVAMKRVKPGDDMSTYTTPMLDGKPFKMADYKGKVVLLYLWNSADGRSSKEAVAMKEIFDAYGKNESFVMIGVCFDNQPEASKEFVKKNGMDWPQVYMGGSSNMYQELGLRMFPSSLLVGADGKLIARDVRRERLKQTIEGALRK